MISKEDEKRLNFGSGLFSVAPTSFVQIPEEEVGPVSDNCDVHEISDVSDVSGVRPVCDVSAVCDVHQICQLRKAYDAEIEL